MIRAIGFDLDGTLVNTAPDMARAANAMLDLLGQAPLPERQIPKLIGGGIADFVERVLRTSTGVAATSPALRAGAEALFRKLYRQRLFERSHVYPGVRQALQTLASAGMPLCCITNKESAFAWPILQAAGLHGYFRYMLCADLAEDRKPSPNLLIAACARLGVEPAHLLYVGDARTDIIAARNAGCHVVAATYGYRGLSELDELHPDETIDNLAEVTTYASRRCSDTTLQRAKPLGSQLQS